MGAPMVCVVDAIKWGEWIQGRGEYLGSKWFNRYCVVIRIIRVINTRGTRYLFIICRLRMTEWRFGRQLRVGPIQGGNTSCIDHYFLVRGRAFVTILCRLWYPCMSLLRRDWLSHLGMEIFVINFQIIDQIVLVAVALDGIDTVQQAYLCRALDPTVKDQVLTRNCPAEPWI